MPRFSPAPASGGDGATSGELDPSLMQLPPLRSADVIDGSDNSGVAEDDDGDGGSSDAAANYTASQEISDEERGLLGAQGTAGTTAMVGTLTGAHASFTRAASAAPLPISAELAARRSRRRRRAAARSRPPPLPHDGDPALEGKRLYAARSLRDDSCACCVQWLGQGSSVLWLFTLCQLLIFYDRGMVAGFLPAIQRDLGALSDTQMGLLGSGFIFGYMLACPLFAFFSKTYSAYKLMAVGLFLWVQAILLCGLTDNFITLLGARILTGVGEASFAGLAPTCIDDVAPLRHRTIWLSFFFSGVPIGSALGYIAGGWFSSTHGPGWHFGFLTEAALMAPVVIVVFLWPSDKPDEETPAAAAAEEEETGVQKSATAAGTVAGAAGSKADRRARKPGWKRRAQAEPPLTAQSTTDTVALALDAEQNEPLQQDSEAEASGASPVGSLPSAHARLFAQSATGGPFISRSISTPALKRLDVPDHFEVPRTAGNARQQQGQERKDTVSVPEAAGGSARPLAAAATPTTPSASNTPSSSTRTLTLAMPPSPVNAASASARSHSGSGASIRPLPAAHRAGGAGPGAARTPALREHSHTYIVPADPSNPFHAPGQHYRPGAYAVATPAHHDHAARGGRRGRTGGDDDSDEEDSWLDPTASLPSPGSYNPHYAAQQLAALQNSRGGGNGEDMFLADVVSLLTDGVYIVVVLGYAALAFVIGALSFWAPVDFSATLHISIARSTQIIGVITFLCGLGGTFFGGWCLDYRGSGKGIFAVTRALELCVAFVSVSIIFALGAVLTTDLTTSMVCLALADFFLFGTGPPVNAALLSVAPKNMRSLAMAMSILLMHALGDLPSPFLMGVITDAVNSIRLALVILCLWLLWTVAFWSGGVALARARGQEFKRIVSLNMARPAHERSALLARRGSTGQFYYAPQQQGEPRSANANQAARQQHRSGLSYQSSGGGGGGEHSDGRSGPSNSGARVRTLSSSSQQQHSGSNTPGGSRRSRSTASTPQQQYRRTGYVSAAAAAAAAAAGGGKSGRSRSASPAVAAGGRASYGSFEAAAQQQQPPAMVVGYAPEGAAANGNGQQRRVSRGASASEFKHALE